MLYPLKEKYQQEEASLFLHPSAHQKNYADLEKRFAAILKKDAEEESEESLLIRGLINLLENVKEFDDPYTIPLSLIEEAIQFDRLIKDTIIVISSLEPAIKNINLNAVKKKFYRVS